MKTYKIAIFSGVYPNTSFLTLLSRKLANNKCVDVQVFGRKIKESPLDKKLKFHTYPQNKFLRLLFIIKYLLLGLLLNYKKVHQFFILLKRDDLYYTRLYIILPMLYHKPDIIHIQWIKSYSIFEGFENCIDSKFILSVRGHQLSISSFIYPEMRKLTLQATNISCKIHSISDDLSNQLLSLNPAIKDKIVKINPAIDLEFFKNENEFNRNEVVRIVTVCRLSWKKGLNYGLKSIKELQDKGIQFHYSIIGDGSQKEELLYLIHDLGLENNVTLHGALPQNQVKNILIDSDIFFLPSLQEGFSNAVIEAQALGLACVVSDAEGLEENIKHGVTGYVFKKRNISSATQVLESLITMNEEDFIKFKYAAKERANNLYSVEDQIKKFRKMYLEVLQ